MFLAANLYVGNITRHAEGHEDNEVLALAFLIDIVMSKMLTLGITDASIILLSLNRIISCMPMEQTLALSGKVLYLYVCK